ncbi:MAG TPA: alpha/beta fold hydrolase [Xanthobacteraceae bacterium]|nr:alpha/beta fold hydrolase [Xanthobacteraceae bacterium]
MRQIQVGELAISLDDVGAGEPVVLIHGLACGKRMWFHQIRALRRRFRVIAYDQRGHGRTDAPAEAKDYSPSHLVRDLSGLLDALGIARASIVGFSLGGGPALGLAASAPHRVSRLVLADVGAGADNMWKSQWLARRWTALIDKGDIDELVCDMLRSEFLKRYARRDRRSREYMAGLIRATPPIGLRHILTEVLAKRKSIFRTTAVLRTLQVPTLIVAGRHDNVCRVAAHLLADSIPNATLEWIDDAGHMAPLENPGQFTARLETFLAR